MFFSPRGFLLLASLVAVMAHGVRRVRVGRRVGHFRADALPFPSSLVSVREVVSEAVGAPDKDDEPVQAAPVHKSGAKEEGDDETSSASSSPPSSPRSRSDSGSSSGSSDDDEADSAESDDKKPPVKKGRRRKRGGLSNKKGSTPTSTTSRTSKDRPLDGSKSTSSRSGEEQGSTDVEDSSGMEASVIRSGSDNGGDGGDGEEEGHVGGVANILDSLDPEIARFLATGRKRERKAELENMSESELQVSDDTLHCKLTCRVLAPVYSPLCTRPCILAPVYLPLCTCPCVLALCTRPCVLAPMCVLVPQGP